MFERGIVDINVRDLMIGDGEDFARAEIKQFQAEFVFDRQPALLAETGGSDESGVSTGVMPYSESKTT